MEPNAESAPESGAFFERLPWPAWLINRLEPGVARGNALAAAHHSDPAAREIAVDTLADLFAPESLTSAPLSQRVVDAFSSASTQRFPARWRATPARPLSLVVWPLGDPARVTAVAIVVSEDQGPDLGRGSWRRLGHDLRGPIAPIRMAVQLLQRGGVAPAEQDSSLRMIDRQIDRLLAVIDAQAELMRLLGSGAPATYEAQDLNLVLDVVCERGSVSKALAAKQQSLYCQPADREVRVDHDQTRLSRLVEFLVGKAIEQAAPGAKLGLSVACSDDRARFCIIGAPATLAADAEVAHVMGVEVVGSEEPGVCPALMREIARRHGVRFEPPGSTEGLAFSLPLSAPGRGR